MQPDDWTKRTLYELATYQNGRAFKPAETRGPDGLPVVKIAELNRGITPVTGMYGGAVEQRHRLRAGDLVFAWSGTLVIARYRGPAAVLNQHIFRVTAAPGVDQRFLEYLLRGFMPQFQRIIDDQRTTMGHVKVADLKRLWTRLPPLPVQGDIAEVLAALDDKKAHNDYLVSTILALNGVAYRRALAASQAEGNARQIPLFEALKVEYGGAYTGEHFNTESQGSPLLRIRDLRTFTPQLWTTESLPRDVHVVPGNVIVGMDAEFRPTIWQGGKALLNQRACRMSSIAGYDSAVVREALAQPLLAVERAKTGTTVIHLNKSDLERVILWLPDHSRTAVLSDELGALRERLLATARESAALNATMAFLLPRLVDGHMPVRQAAPTLSRIA